MVWAADLVIGMTTMLLLEAYLLGRPTLAVLPRISEKEWLVTLSNGLTPTVATHNDLVQMLGTITNSSVKTSTQDILPGNCIERVVQVTVSCLAGAEPQPISPRTY
jgi:hypothetical protein